MGYEVPPRYRPKIRSPAKTSKVGLVLDIFKLVFDVMQTVSFMMFIEEEGIQIRGFGIMSLMREELVDEVAVQVDSLEIQVNSLEEFADSWGWVAPYMRPTYLNYAQAARDQIDAWRAWVASASKKVEKCGVRIYSSPTNSQIFINGKDTEKITTQSFYDLEPGTYKFKLKYRSTRRGLLVYEEDITIETAKIKEFRYVLEEA